MPTKFIYHRLADGFLRVDIFADDTASFWQSRDGFSWWRI